MADRADTIIVDCDRDGSRLSLPLRSYSSRIAEGGVRPMAVCFFAHSRFVNSRARRTRASAGERPSNCRKPASSRMSLASCSGLASAYTLRSQS
jgi:hypothetical protein